jgi:hypothetical protein
LGNDVHEIQTNPDVSLAKAREKSARGPKLTARSQNAKVSSKSIWNYFIASFPFAANLRKTSQNDVWYIIPFPHT